MITQSSPTLLLGVMLIAPLVAPWAMRLIAFGAGFTLDKLLNLLSRRDLRFDQPRAFLARKIGKAPARTYGFLTRDGSGNVIFVYRPWLVLRKRAVLVQRGNLGVARGALSPSLWAISEEDGRRSRVAKFLPRYQSLDNLIAAHLNASAIPKRPSTDLGSR